MSLVAKQDQRRVRMLGLQKQVAQLLDKLGSTSGPALPSSLRAFFQEWPRWRRTLRTVSRQNSFPVSNWIHCASERRVHRQAGSTWEVGAWEHGQQIHQRFRRFFRESRLS